MTREPQFVTLESAQQLQRQIGVALDKHAKEILRISKVVETMDYGRQVEAYKEAVRDSYSQAQGYNNVVLGVGYAGYFGLWALVKDVLSPKAHTLSAILLGISLIAYVGWVVQHHRGAQASRSRVSRARAGVR